MKLDKGNLSSINILKNMFKGNNHYKHIESKNITIGNFIKYKSWYIPNTTNIENML